jgi:hypothetical protein
VNSASESGRVPAQTENKANTPKQEFSEIEATVKSYRYFARWTTNLLNLALVLTQDFNLQDFENAREKYFDNTYLPELTSAGRISYELRKCAKQISDNLTDAEQILGFQDPNVSHIVTNLTWPPYIDMQNEFANVQVVIEASVMKHIDILKRMSLNNENSSALQDFIIRQGIRWNKVSKGV